MNGLAPIKKLLPRTLFARSLLILAAPIFLVQIITIYTFFDRHWQKMGDRLAFGIAGEVAMIAEQIQQDDSDQNIAGISALAARELDFMVQYERGEILDNPYSEKRKIDVLSRKHVILGTLSNAFFNQMEKPFRLNFNRDGKSVEIFVQVKGGVLRVVLPERRIYSSSGYVVLLWMAGSSIILLIIATLFMRNQIRPIRRLAVAADRFGKGRDVPFFKEEGAYEVRQAARAFMGMKDRLQRQIQQRTQMLAGVSHDLRTPITRMKLQLSMMGNSSDIRDLKNDVADMERMIEAYLQFARGEGDEEPVRISLKNLIDQAVSPFNREDAWIKTEVAEDVTLMLRPVAFQRCLGNVLSNALKYGKHAWITARRFETNIEICIDDDGPGIPPEQYEDVFKPFFRGETSRNAKTGGIGLGLPIVRDIIHAHGGRVWLDQSPKGGLRVVMELPV